MLTCPHGFGLAHLVLDLWWVVAIVVSTPWYYIRRKTNKGKLKCKNH